MSELPAEITSYKGRLCEKHSDFIWGDYIDDSIVEGLYHFWHMQDIIAFHYGMVFNDVCDDVMLYVCVSRRRVYQCCRATWGTVKCHTNSTCVAAAVTPVCPWSTPTDHQFEYDCVDGTTAHVVDDGGFHACSSHGGKLKCPGIAPVSMAELNHRASRA